MKRAAVGAVLIALTLIILSPLARGQDKKKEPPRGSTPPAAKAKDGAKKAAAKSGAKKAAAKAAAKGGKKKLGAYALKKGTRLAGGRICYVGANHRPWSIRFFSAEWRLWFLFDPNTAEWYFWHPLQRRYLPVALLRSMAPPLPPPGVTPQDALRNTVPINVNNVPARNNVNIPNLPRNPNAPAG